MGIPYFFKSIIDKYDKSILGNSVHDFKVENFYLDFNSIIHQCANVYVEKHKHDNIDEYYAPIIKLIIQHLVSLLNIIKPTKCVYVAIDGLCPMAKIHQQRKRRFMSSWRKKQLGDNNIWDSNVITPGSEFMDMLNHELLSFCEINKTFFNYQLVISPSSEYGEGEHKIFSHMTNENSIIYGLDADLIMLSMINKNAKNIRLLRDRPAFNISKNIMQNEKYIFLNIWELKKQVELKSSVSIEEYVVLCFFMGNDFLPPLSYMSIRTNGIEQIISAYNITKKNAKIIDNNNSINNKGLEALFSYIAVNEYDLLKEATNLFYNDYGKKRNGNKLDLYPSYTKTSPYYNVNNNWIVNYYDKISNGENIQNMCNDYITGVHWIHAYYFKKTFSYTWFYKHNYSPLISDLSLHMKKKQIYQFTETDDLHHHLLNNQDLQLVLVLPPSSNFIIRSSKIRKMQCDVSAGFVQFYPLEFKVETFLKHFLWECIPLIPKIDLGKLKRYITINA